MVENLKNCNLVEVIGISILINVLLYAFSLLLYAVICKVSIAKPLQEKEQTLLKKDIFWSVITILCNAFVFVFGVFLWKNGEIILNNNGHWYTCIVEIFFLIISMDFLMYCFHRIVHLAIFFPLVHRRHHSHVSTNIISLFVLHPLEAIGFGFLFILVIFLHPFSVVSISIYLTLNLIWGTVGHLNVEIFPKKISKIWLLNLVGNVAFHNLHHQFPSYNFGFYTMLWDKLFGTIAPEMKEK